MVSSFAYTADEEWQFSLMYKPEEGQIIEEGRKIAQNGKHHKKPVSMAQIRLNGIAFIDADHWTVWINEQMVDPYHAHPDIEIGQVTAEGISFSLKNGGHKALVKLEINQTIDLNVMRYAAEGDSELKDQTNDAS